MIKKSEQEMRAELTKLRALAGNPCVSADTAAMADMAAHALHWALDADAGSAAASELMAVMPPEASTNAPDPAPDGLGSEAPLSEPTAPAGAPLGESPTLNSGDDAAAGVTA